MKIHLRFVPWFMLFCIPWLAACGEVVNEYYISNHTDLSLTVSLTPRYLDTVDLLSGPLIEDIRKSARPSLQQPIHFEQAGETVHFEIPPKTTVFLGFSSGGNDLFSHLEVRSESRQFVMDDNDYRDYFTVHDRFVGAVVHVFNVE